MTPTSPSLLPGLATLIVAATTFLPGFAPAAQYAADNDINPRVESGRMVTDALDDATLGPLSDVRHFGYHLSTSATNPYFTSNPGVNALAGSGLPAGAQLRFDLLRKLVRWNGQGGVRFENIVGNEQLRLQFGAASAVATGSSGFVPGYSLGNIGSSGSIHRHLNAFLEGVNPPAPGLYFTVLRLFTSSSSVLPSRAVYIAYNNGLSPADFSRGMNYLANPTPGDVDFDSDVDFDDLLVLAQNYGRRDANWFNADFNGDDAVDFDDLLPLAQRYGSTAAAEGAEGATFESDWALARAMVPEPAAAGVLAVLIPLCRKRYR